MRISSVAVALGASLGLAGLGLASCQQGGEATAEASAPQQASDNAAEAEAFVRSVYATSSDNMVDPLWSARTDAELDEIDRLTEDGVTGFFAADPICDCQDGTPVLREVTATSTGPDSADVAVVQGFSEFEGVHRKTYRLVREGGNWRIDDMTYQEMGPGMGVFPSFRAQLAEWLADARAQSK